MKKFFLLVTIFLCSMLSCKSSDETSLDDNDFEVPEYEIFVVDSFGVEISDSVNMLGSIVSFCGYPEGDMLLLDESFRQIRVISIDNVNRFISRSGEAPGELLAPMAICSTEDGRILVSDEMKHEVSVFNYSGDYLGEFLSTDFYVPYAMNYVLPNSIVSDLVSLDTSTEIPEYVYSVMLFNEGEHIPAITYAELRWAWTSANFYRDIEVFDFTAGYNGEVFIASDVTNYRITCFSPAGQEQYVIYDETARRIRKTDEQIQNEIREFEEWAKQDQAYMGGYEPVEYYPLIDLVGVDSSGNLWVRKLYESPGIVCDVYDNYGKLIYTARLPRTNDDVGLNVSIDKYSFIAVTDSEADYGRAYRLSVLDSHN